MISEKEQRRRARREAEAYIALEKTKRYSSRATKTAIRRMASGMTAKQILERLKTSSAW